MDTPPESPKAARRVLLPALAHRNYRLFFLGQGVSLIGTWMQRLAMGVLVYDLTGSAFLLGAVGFCSQILTFVVAPLAGVVADRVNRRRLLVVAQTLAMLQALALAALTLSGHIHLWHIMALSLLQGLCDGFEITTRQSFVVEMLETRRDLTNAIAMNSFLVHSSRLIGPTVGGVLVARWGSGVCFLVNGLSFLAVIAALLAMKIQPRPHRGAPGRILHNMLDGVKYTFGFAPIRAILLLVAGMSLLGVSYGVLMPAFAKDVLHVRPDALGMLMGAAGAGALCGAGFLATRKSVLGLERAMAIAAVLCGAGLIALSFTRSLWPAMALLVVVGLGAMIVFASSNTVIQTIVDDDRRGRVMSLYMMCFMGMGPFGSLIAGAMARHFESSGAILFGGCACIVSGLLFGSRLRAFSKLIRPIYVRMGIAPDVAATNVPTPLGASPPDTRY